MTTPTKTQANIGQLPNLVVIGSMKCGTTSLHQYLDCHPEIFMSKKKEINFFIADQYWENGTDWYRQHFVTEKAIRGESSQDYTKFHMFGGVPERMHQVIPEAKLVYLVRDPLERMLSHYYENIYGGQAPPDLNRFLTNIEDNHYIKTSQYYQQIQAYLEYFDASQILVVETEALKSQRLDTMNEIFRFLGLAELDDESAFDFEANTRSTKRQPNKLAAFVQGPSSALLRKLMPRGLKDQIKGLAMFKKLTHQKIKKKEQIDPELADAIRAYLKPDIEAFRAFSGKPLASWSL